MICHSGDGFAQVVSDKTPPGQEKKFQRQLFVSLDVKRKDIEEKEFLREAKEKNGNANGLNAKLGAPDEAAPLLYRSPTAFEERLYAAGETDPLHVLHRTVVLTYASKTERDKQKEKVVKVDGVKGVYEPLDILLSQTAPVYPNEKDLFFGPQGSENSVIDQWGMHLLRFPQAWGKSRGSAWIGAVDGGIKTDHSDLAVNFRKHLSRNFNQLNYFDSVDRLPGSAADTDLYAVHGTHVAGILAARMDNARDANNNFILQNGVVGGCPNCSFTMMKWGDQDEQQAINGIVRAVDVGMQVLNLSFETRRDAHKFCDMPLPNYSPPPGYTQQEYGGPLCGALSHAARNGVAMAAAAGNHGNKASTTAKRDALYNLPAVHPDVMAVSGLTITSNPSEPAPNSGLRFWFGRQNPVQTNDWWGSNYGTVTNGVPQISFAAPAQQVISTVYPSLAYIGNQYGADSACDDFANPSDLVSNADGIGYCTGTSMAAPHVAAMAGLVKSVNPLLDTAGVKSALIQSATCLETGTDRPCSPTSQLGGVAGDAMKKLGYGVPKADSAVKIALGGGTAVNRMTPLFAFYQQTVRHSGITQGHQHFYTTNPQMAIAALRNTLQPAPKFKIAPTLIDCVAMPSNCESPVTVNGINIATPLSVKKPDGSACNANECAIDWILERTTDGFRKVYTSPPNGALNSPTQSFPTGLLGNPVFRTLPIATYPLVYTEIGKEIPGYPNFPCGSTYSFNNNTNSACSFYPARAVAMLMTTHVNPSGGADLIPVYRLSCAPDDTFNESQDAALKPFHVTFRYLTNPTLLAQLTGGGGTNTYKLDGIEGYVFSAANPPQNTKRLCSRYDSVKHDYILFIEGEGQTANGQPTATCESTYSDGYAGGFAYSSNHVADTVALGYAYPVQRPKAMPENTSPVPHSFDGGVFADILWKHTTNTNLAIWLQPGTPPSTDLFGPGFADIHKWKIVGVGDFNADGKADIFWQGIQAPYTNQLAVWFMNGAAQLGASFVLPNLPAGGEALGVGDFNGDGFADVLLRNTTTGQLSVMLMTFSGTVQITPINAFITTGNYLGGIGDFDGDGKADILVMNSTGGLAGQLYFMDGATVKPASGALITPYNGTLNVADWRVRGVGDVNGDGFADIVWQNITAPQGDSFYQAPSVWLMKGRDFHSFQTFNVSGTAPGWKIVAVRDFDNDGKADLLWHRVVGGTANNWNGIWFMDGFAIKPGSGINVNDSPPGWVVQPVVP